MAKAFLMAAVLLMIFTTTVDASPIQITGGMVSTDWRWTWDVDGTFVGEGINLRATWVTAFSPTSLNIGITNIQMPTWGPIVVNGVVYDSLSPFGQSNNLRLTFTYEPIPTSTTNVIGSPAVHEPFTMVGTLNLLEQGTGNPVIFDLAGQGVVDVFWRDAVDSTFPFLHVDFNFTPVPEPSGLMLVPLGIGALTTCVYQRKARRIRRTL